MRVERLSQRAAGGSLKDFLLRHAWKLGLALIALALLTVRGVNDPMVSRFPIYTLSASGGGPTLVPCAALLPGTTVWSSAGSPYILPVNAANNLDSSVTPCPGITVPQGATLEIDASAGPVQIFSHGAGIILQGGELWARGASPASPVTFDAEPDVASWDGISIHSGPGGKGDASFEYSSIEHALTAITIDSGATSSPDSSNYGLTLQNSNVVNSYFDGIDATDTPISLTGAGDGRSGTVNNIGSFGIKFGFDKQVQLPANALNVDGIVFGSSVPFAETGCAPLSSCAAGTIGNDAIQGTFPLALTSSTSERVSVTHSSLFRAGSFGVDLTNPYDPVIHDNTFDCNGTGSPDTRHGLCTSSVATKSSPIYLNNATSDLDLNVYKNSGNEDGLEAIVFNGNVISPTFHWKSAMPGPTTDLGYVLNGNLNMSGGTFYVPAGAVVKVKGGTINLTNTTLDASDTSIPGPAGAKIFTSLRDSSVGVAAGCSVFVQVCSPPLPLPPGDWGGIDLVSPPILPPNATRANAKITNANIQYATTGVQIANGATSTLGNAPYGLVISSSSIGPTFADAIDATDAALSVTGTTLGCPTAACANASPIRNHGILADFSGAGPLGGGLNLDHNVINGTGNEAILGLALSRRDITGQVTDSQNVTVTSNTVSNAGVFGIKLDRANNPTLMANTVNASGTGSPSYPAIYMPDVANANFVSGITGNNGAGDGLNAIGFHGTVASDLSWKTIGAAAALGYLVDGNLTVNGKLTLNPADYVPVLGGAITVKGHELAADHAVVTSLREQALGLPSCGSIFVPKRSDGTCQAQAPGDWNGFNLTSGQPNIVTNSEIRYATTGITVNLPNLAAASLSLTSTNIRNSAGDGVVTGSSLSVSGGAFTNLTGRGIAADLSNSGAGAQLSVDHLSVAATGSDGILIKGGDAGKDAVTNSSVDHAGGFGVHLVATTNPTVKGNRVTNTAVGYPAMYLEWVDQADFNNSIGGNTGGLNGVNALAFHGNVSGPLTWVTARTSANLATPLGYIADGDVNLTDSTLTVNAGGIVKISNGHIKLSGGRLDASSASTSSQKVFTSLQDTTVGVPCPINLASVNCSSAGAAGQWNGFDLTTGPTSKADGTVVNASIRYATTGLYIDSTAASTLASSVYGLVVSRSSISSGSLDGIGANNTGISVTNSVISGLQAHGINLDLTTAANGTPLRLSGNRIMSTTAEAILGQGLAGRSVWISDNRIVNAGTFGVRLVSADQLVLRNNAIASSGNSAGGPYAAVYLNGVKADFAQNVRGNVGQGNGLNAIVMHGTATGNLNWITPKNAGTLTTYPLGYLLDGSLTVDGGNLHVESGGVVKALGGRITLKGGKLDAAGATFTSLRDNVSVPVISCPSFITQDCTTNAGDWGGLLVTASNTSKGAAFLDQTTIDWADTGITIDSGPIGAAFEDPAFAGYPGYRLIVRNHSTISNAALDGINTLDTPIFVDGSGIASVGRYGISASLLSPANCASTAQTECNRLNVTGSVISNTGQDGVVANGLLDQHVDISDNTVTNAGTYGIRLISPDMDTEVSENDITASGVAVAPGKPNYPAIYLSNVDGDFNPSGTIYGNRGLGNGMDAVVFHGTANNSLTWVTPGSIAATATNPYPPLGYMLDGDLTINGNLTATGVVKVLGGTIKINGALNTTGATFTSMQEAGAPSACGSVFVSACPLPPLMPSSWGGINIDAGASSLTGGAIRYADQGVAITGASLSVSGVQVANLNGDAFSVTDSAATSSFDDTTIDQVAGNGINLTNSDATLARDVISNISGTGNYAVVTSGGTAAISCSNIHDNANGLSLAGPSTVNDSNTYNNAGYDLIGTSGTPVATGVWYGVPDGFTPGKVTGATLQNLLHSDTPNVTLALGGSDPTATDTPAIRALSSGPTGAGTITAVVTVNRPPDTTTNADVSFTTGTGDGPHDITTATGVGGTWTGSVWTSNPYPLSLGALAGTNHFTATVRDCIPQDANGTGQATQDANLAVTPTAVTMTPPAAATYGGSTTLSAMLTSNSLALGPGKTVNFAITNTSHAVVATATAQTDSFGVATTSPVSLVNLDAASYGVSAVFNGDNSYAPSPTDSSKTLTIQPVQTVVTSSASADNVVAGGSVTDRAAITGVGGTASGTVTYTLYNSTACSTSVFTGTTAAFADGQVPASAAQILSGAGTYSWRASYSGDGNHLGDTSACSLDNVAVVSATPTITTTPSSGATVGGTISDKATLTGGSSPTGTISFSLYGPGDTTCATDLKSGDLTFQKIPLDVTLSATTPSFTTTQAGTYQWIARYNGDGANSPVASGCGTETVTVAQAMPALATVASAGGAVGTNITDTANVTAGYNPTGSVSFSLYAPGDTTCATDLLATSNTFHNVTLTSGSATSPAYTTLHAGDYRWVASYSGDANNAGTTTGCSDEKVTITKASPVVATVASPAGEVGTTISDTAKVSGGAGPSGNVSFALYGPGDAACATDLLASDGTFHNIALVNGSASTPDYTTTSAGTYHWIATYNGDADNVVVSTGCGDEPVTVAKAIPTLSTDASPGGTVGGTISDTATVTGGYNPGGAVDFELYGPGDSTCTTNLVQSDASYQNVPLTSGSATSPAFTTTLAGDYRWVVDYLGDPNNVDASSGCNDEVVPVAGSGLPPAVASVNPSSGPVAGGTQVTITGTHLSPTIAVTFGTIRASSFTAVSDSQIVATSPVSSASTVDITVTTPAGTSAAAAADQFTFVAYSATILSDSPLIYYRLGESSGTVAHDASAHADDGTYSAMGVTLGQPGALLGDADTAVKLDGTSGAIQETVAGGAPTGSASRTLEIWFKTSNAAAQPLFNYGSAGSHKQFTVGLTAADVTVADGSPTPLTFTAAASLADGAWHHLVVVYDNLAMSTAVYVDGSAVGMAQSLPGLTTAAGTVLQIGTDGVGHFNGTLDEAAIYGTALSSVRVAAHYHAGQGD